MLTDDALEFLREYHLATLSTLGRGGRVHAVPVGFTYEAGVVRVIGTRGSQKFLNAQRSGRASICSVDRGRWISFEGTARILEEPDAVAHAVELHAARYRRPRVNPERVVLEMSVERVLGSPQFRG
ncbi:PPOX class F420-dependent oxidoreductase [Microbacterium sulfonylureivorans]|uniref:PPOX class F420-dependent oxidoreductase n=1 Tax=Microbacterium sulfonylureivorans TaxID=2486854 RepID=UPI000FD786DA|nr:PPOX class F420-dependent oxidoreductase [Microbacterium sulfonylureivorans]